MKRILVAEDETMTREAVALLLTAAGYAVDATDDGHEVIRRLARPEPPDLLVCDVQLPGETGIGILAWMQAQGISLPVVAITGFNDADTTEALQRHPGCRIVFKPFGPDELMTAIATALGDA